MNEEREREENFKTLPPRILPDDHVELVETRQGESRPYSAPSEAQQAALYSAGG
ncbi:hypothetical protein [Actinoplanes aureus]|uniref:Uncharacterized protein n=1 Tax=Actinoplanes aureus TaxID=2792083 RepID=A0A931FXN8_9ACTN|nr:hypothetical protein [Actinoplanes aureus]MBG0562902.1 hypothetical protein [Actinoplanes aureus]